MLFCMTSWIIDSTFLAMLYTSEKYTKPWKNFWLLVYVLWSRYLICFLDIIYKYFTLKISSIKWLFILLRSIEMKSKEKNTDQNDEDEILYETIFWWT